MGSVTYIELMEYLSKISIMISFEINLFPLPVNFSTLETGPYKKIMIKNTRQIVQRLFTTDSTFPVKNGLQIALI
jgi:hypothetical protein